MFHTLPFRPLVNYSLASRTDFETDLLELRDVTLLPQSPFYVFLLRDQRFENVLRNNVTGLHVFFQGDGGFIVTATTPSNER